MRALNHLVRGLLFRGCLSIEGNMSEVSMSAIHECLLYRCLLSRGVHWDSTVDATNRLMNRLCGGSAIQRLLKYRSTVGNVGSVCYIGACYRRVSTKWDSTVHAMSRLMTIIQYVPTAHKNKRLE